jgi:RNA polymerase sigma-70 factor (ECF subfamily)
MQAALQRLSAERREAILLIGAGGFSYEEAALICDCAIGTMKSRVARARAELARMLDPAEDGDDKERVPRQRLAAGGASRSQAG